MLLSVVIVNYNVKFFLEQCLLSVLKATKNIECEIIVVDNHSSDGSKDFFAGRFPEVQFIWKNENVGFARANNEAIKMSRGAYLLILNPDTIIPEDSLQHCIEFIKTKNNQCALGIKMIDGSGNFLRESKRAFPDPITALFKLIGLARLFPHSKIFARYHLGHLDKNKNHEVDVLAGAFLMLPRNILEEVKGFDEDYFMYGEDVDLSFRIQKAGFKNYYFSESTILHFKGESTKKGSLNYVRMFYAAMSIFARKHYGNTRAGVLHFFIQLAILMRAGVSALFRFIKWIGVPAVDAIIILLSFFLAKNLWEAHLEYEMNYSTNLIVVAFPIFTFLFLASSYFSGLYDNGFKQSQLNKSTLTAILVILSFYALLPESYRYSRVVMLLGTLLAFLWMSLLRIVFIKWGLVKAADKNASEIFSYIIGNEEEFQKVADILKKEKNHLLSHWEANKLTENSEQETFKDFTNQMPAYLENEIIFCEGILSIEKILSLLPLVPKQVDIQFFMNGSSALVGSKNPNLSGNIIDLKGDYRLALGVAKRNKRFVDFAASLIFILSFPFHFLLKKNSFRFFKNCFSVLIAKKTWVGYAGEAGQLPPLKPGVINTLGKNLSQSQSYFPTNDRVNQAYAKNYTVWDDIRLIVSNYYHLS